MKTFLNALLFSVLLTALVVSGCMDDPLAPRSEEPFDKDVFTRDGSEITPHGDTFFTGRDSLFGTMMFGVSLKARVSGTWNDDDNCKVLNGTGSATHLGRIDVKDQEICIEDDHSITGGFELEGRRSKIIAGEYRALPDEPSLSNGIFSAGLEITRADVAPRRSDDIGGEGTWVGWGWINGELQDDNSFTYKIDGWLHHKEVNVPGLENPPWK